MMTAPRKILGVFSLVMINIIAVDSLRSLPIGAEYGLSLIFFYVLAAGLFFIPTALVTAELATGWPNLGGVYVWVREAFGVRAGFWVIWLQWIYNLIWYPTILSFVAATIAYLFKPELGNNCYYQLFSVLVLFWLSTWVNCRGMKTSSLVSAIGAIVGTLLPMFFISILGIIWYYKDMPIQLHFSWQALLPNHDIVNNLGFFLGLLFGLIGLEMSAVHAAEVKNPARDYPKALLYSVLLIIFTLIAASLAIAIVVPHTQLSLVTGLIEAFAIFFKAWHMPWMVPVIVIMIILGAFAGVSAWIIGPTKGLLVAVNDYSTLPKKLTEVNEHGVPVKLLLVQGAIFTVLCSVFILLPTVNSAYWLLTAMTSQLALLEYILLFAAAVRLHYSMPNVTRAFRIPGGRVGLWLVSSLGIAVCVFAILLGFLPPTDLHITNVLRYESILFFGMIIFALPPWLVKLRT